MKLNELLKQDKKAKEYFSSLPAFVQETLTQTSPDCNSFEDMRRCVEKLMLS